MDYEPVIGLEVHAQLLTQSKMFCRCRADYAAAPPNTRVCPICLGMPGVLPTINRRAIEYSVMTALALNCSIPEFTKFDRKNYPYPDLMKGYQISQYDAPLSRQGWMNIEVDGQRKRVGITRVHLEEDTAKLLHRSEPHGETYSLVDVNRSGVPLMEIVGEPDLRSPEEARQYLIRLRSILLYLGVSTGSMEEGSFRCDANVSVRPVGSSQFGAKVEVKNMNSFRAVYRALEYEIVRQIRVLEGGGRIVQETRGWVEDRGITVGQRSKEFAHDYRYFPEPDLPPLVFSREWVEDLRQHLPELPEARRDRLVSQYGLPAYDANLLTETRAMSDFFEAAVARAPKGERTAKTVSNWMMGEMRRLLGASGKEITEIPITSDHLVELIGLVERGVVNEKTAKVIFEEMFTSGQRPEAIVQERGWTQISDTAELEAVIEAVIEGNARAVADYAAGKAQAITFLLGQVMRATRGQADPALTNRLVREKLSRLVGQK